MSEETVRRVKGNWRTTVMGIPIFLFGIIMLVMKVLCWFKITDACDFTIGEILPTLALGYSLIMAKDSLLEGVTMGLFKLKK